MTKTIEAVRERERAYLYWNCLEELEHALKPSKI